MTSPGWRAADIAMLVVFLLSALVQINDPDPLPWIAVYGAAAALCAASLARRGSRAAPALLLAVSLAAAARLAPRVLASAEIADIFGSMKATDPLVEETREMLGLLIVAAWMAVLAWRGREAPATPRNVEGEPE
jgi:hypothetical protein